MKSLRIITFAIIGVAVLTAAGCGPKNNGSAKAPVNAVPAVSITLNEANQAAGIQFAHNNGAFGAKLLPETMGAGVGFLDYDQDLDPDLFVVNGRDWTAQEIEAFKNGSGRDMASKIPAQLPKRGGTCRLYQNNGNGTFTDVTNGSGIDVPMFGMGVSVGDYDNDGRTDMYVTAVSRNYLFRNIGPGKFQDVSQQAGVRDSGWSTSSAFVDYDKDGKLDLFVCHYVEWTPATDIFNTVDGKNKAYTTPEQYVGQASRLYKNVGGGRFTDVSDKAGILKRKGTGESAGKPLQGKSLGVTICDYDSDGWPDIVVANDTEPNYLFRNNGDGTFNEVGIEAGIALSEAGVARAAMGVDAGDIDRSGRESLLFGNYSNQMLGLYKNQSGRVFIDVAPASEVGRASLQYLAFGACLLDIDNDGWLDIFTANGHLDEDIDTVQRDVKYLERPLLFRNTGDGSFVEIGTGVGPAFARPIVGRGAAYADIDLDGDLDLAITTNGGPLYFFRNDGGTKNESIRILLEGTKSNRLGIGAEVEVRAGTDVIRRTARSGSSYCSQSEIPLTMGLGQHMKADSITVKWPSGKTTELKDINSRQIVTINENAGILATQPMLRKAP